MKPQSCIATLIGYVWTPRDPDSTCGPILTDGPKDEHLSPDLWIRRPCYTLTPEPTIDVIVAKVER